MNIQSCDVCQILRDGPLMTAQAGGQFSRPSPHAGFTARVLPTDFDGVLHPTLAAGVDSSGGLVATKHFGWVPVLEKALRGHEDVVIVVHSTWRHEYDLDELRGVLGKLAPRVIASTPRNLSRYESIVFWLEQNPSFASYRILDDDVSEFPVPSPPELIFCKPLTGVSAPKVLQALADWLGPPTTERKLRNER